MSLFIERFRMNFPLLNLQTRDILIGLLKNLRKLWVMWTHYINLRNLCRIVEKGSKTYFVMVQWRRSKLAIEEFITMKTVSLRGIVGVVINCEDTLSIIQCLTLFLVIVLGNY
jgi:hypothetical protein